MAPKQQAFQKFHFSVEDENGNLITSGLRVSVFVAGSATEATIYSDAYSTALTNPITSAVFATNTGNVEFWYGGSAVDVVINDGIGRLVAINSLTPSQNRVIFDSRQAVSGVIGNVSGTDLADDAGVFVDYEETVTLDGSLLRAGDIVKIGGWLIIDDYHTVEELDFKVFASDVTLLHTGDMVPAGDNDYLRFDITLKVITAGSSGKVIWSAAPFTNLGGTLALLNGTVEDGISLAGTTLDMSGDVIIKASGDYAAAHADQESQVYWDVQVLKGVLYTT